MTRIATLTALSLFLSSALAGGTASQQTIPIQEVESIQLLKDFPLYLKSNDVKFTAQPPRSCAAPRRVEGVEAYIKTLTPNTRLTATERAKAGVGNCAARAVLNWHNPDLPNGNGNAPMNAAIKNWYDQMKVRGARVEWHGFRDARLNFYGITYKGKYYFVEQLFEGYDASITVTATKYVR